MLGDLMEMRLCTGGGETGSLHCRDSKKQKTKHKLNKDMKRLLFMAFAVIALWGCGDASNDIDQIFSDIQKIIGEM